MEGLGYKGRKGVEVERGMKELEKIVGIEIDDEDN